MDQKIGSAPPRNSSPFTCAICLDDVCEGEASVGLLCESVSNGEAYANPLTLSKERSSGETTANNHFGDVPPPGVDSVGMSSITIRHTFCPPCIAAELLARPVCPLCRHPVAPAIAAGAEPRALTSGAPIMLLDDHELEHEPLLEYWRDRDTSLHHARVVPARNLSDHLHFHAALIVEYQSGELWGPQR